MSAPTPRRGCLAALLALAVAAAAGASSARAETRPRYGGSVTGAVLGAPGTFDPLAARSHAEVSLAGLLFDGLYRLDENGAPAPQLARTLPARDPARGVVVIPLRAATFHDGTPVTSAAVAASLERVRGSALGFLLAGATSVTAVDGAVELAGPIELSLLARRLAMPQAGIAPERAVRGDGVVGSGPFQLAVVRRKERLARLVAFAGYHAGRPYLDEVVLQWYDTPDGEARKFELGGSQISLRGATAFGGAEPKYRAGAVEGPPAVLVFVGFGAAHAELTGRREVRTALDLALARGGFGGLGSGEQVIPTRSPVPPGAGGPALPAAARGGDVAAAQAQLAAASPPLTPQQLSSARLEISFDDSRPDDREVAERVVRALDKLGLRASLLPLSAPALRERVDRGECDLWIGQLAAPVDDAAMWRELAWSLAPRAVGKRGARASQRGRRGDLARRFEAELPIVPLYFRGLRASHRTDVRGVAFDPSGQLRYADLFLFGEPERSRKGAP